KENADVLEIGLLHQFEDPRHQGHVRAGQKAQSEPIGVFVGDSAHNSFGDLPKPSVDHMHAGVAQRPRHDLDAAIVAVEPDLGEHDAYGLVHPILFDAACGLALTQIHRVVRRTSASLKLSANCIHYFESLTFSSFFSTATLRSWSRRLSPAALRPF